MEDSDLVYSGKKESVVHSIDPLTGDILATFDDSSGYTALKSLRNGVFITKIHYT